MPDNPYSLRGHETAAEPDSTAEPWEGEQIVETLRDEANALFAVNQAGRSAAERVAALLFTLAGVGVAAGVAAKTVIVVVPLAPLSLLLMSYMYEQYTDVSITGAARWVLEERLKQELRDPDRLVLYEHSVAGIRQKGSLVRSGDYFKLLVSVVVMGTVVLGVVMACVRLTPLLATLAIVSTFLSGIAAGWSRRTMLRSYGEARRQLGEPVLPSQGASYFRRPRLLIRALRQRWQRTD